MKNRFLLLSFILIPFLTLKAQNNLDVFYYYQGEKIFLKNCRDKIFIYNINGEIKPNTLNISLIPIGKGYLLEMQNDSIIPDFVINYYNSQPNVIVHKLFNYKGYLQYATNLFVVQLKSGTTLAQLQDLVIKYGCTIEENNIYEPDQYSIKSSSTDEYGTIDLANVFYETGLFEFSEPEFIWINAFNSNDPYFSNQWGLSNIGQNEGTAGIDINVEQAWEITKGSETIKTAVIDQGIDLTHPDLFANLLPGYDVTGNNSAGAPVWNFENHGTACAGIISALNDNGVGITGVSPNSKLIPIHASSASGGLSIVNVANAIRISFILGADIINCSFGGGAPSDNIRNAINAALSQGRNGKGCVIVAAAGNNNASSVNFPSSIDGVISVGAIDRCGIRSGRIDIVPNSCDPWCPTCEPGSAYGDKLCVVAPGTNIYTTDRQSVAGYNTAFGTSGDYTSFGGTSAACPYVAGVAALVLSVNQNLTSSQVIDIIAATSKKLTNYQYNISPAHPRGLWNNETGYGLVDAYAAVQEALKSDLYIRDTVTDNGSMPSPAAYTWNSPDIWVEDLNENVVENPLGNTTYNVCVRIYNRRDVASTGTEKLCLNWAKAGFNDYWYEYWTSYNPLPCGAYKGGFIGNPNGNPIPSIPANSSYVKKVAWTTPSGDDYRNCTQFSNDPWHFCLCARIHDDDEIAHENEQLTEISPMVRNHNNVAQRNVYFSHTTTYDNGDGKSQYSIANPTITSKSREICLVPSSFNSNVVEYPDVRITFDAGLLTSINTSGISGWTWVNSNTLRWTGGTACIPLTLAAESFHTLKVDVNFLVDQNSLQQQYDFDLVLSDPVDGILGGEHFSCTPAERCGFDLDVTVSVEVDMLSFHIEEEDDFVSYELIDMYGNVYSYYGGDFDYYPAESGCYILRVTTWEGCCVYDTICVTVPDAMLSSIYPNPADGEVNIDYQLSRRISGGTIQIISANGVKMYSQAVTNTTKGKTMKGSLKLSTAAYAPGQYIVRILSSKGEVYDSKTLIVK